VIDANQSNDVIVTAHRTKRPMLSLYANNPGSSQESSINENSIDNGKNIICSSKSRYDVPMQDLSSPESISSKEEDSVTLPLSPKVLEQSKNNHPIRQFVSQYFATSDDTIDRPKVTLRTNLPCRRVTLDGASELRLPDVSINSVADTTLTLNEAICVQKASKELQLASNHSRDTDTGTERMSPSPRSNSLDLTASPLVVITESIPKRDYPTNTNRYSKSQNTTRDETTKSFEIGGRGESWSNVDATRSKRIRTVFNGSPSRCDNLKSRTHSYISFPDHTEFETIINKNAIEHRDLCQAFSVETYSPNKALRQFKFYDSPIDEQRLKGDDLALENDGCNESRYHQSPFNRSPNVEPSVRNDELSRMCQPDTKEMLTVDTSKFLGHQSDPDDPIKKRTKYTIKVAFQRQTKLLMEGQSKQLVSVPTANRSIPRKLAPKKRLRTHEKPNTLSRFLRLVKKKQNRVSNTGT
jgi:hypothetical protein